MIDLSLPCPSWQRLPDMHRQRNRVNSVILPDGRIFVAGGYLDPDPGGGHVEIFDPDDPGAGWLVGPSMAYSRGYHSSAILLPDGSVLMGGDKGKGTYGTKLPPPDERYFPGYCFKPRPVITSTSTVTLHYGSTLSIQTSHTPYIAEVVLISTPMLLC